MLEVNLFFLTDGGVPRATSLAIVVDTRPLRSLGLFSIFLSLLTRRPFRMQGSLVDRSRFKDEGSKAPVVLSYLRFFSSIPLKSHLTFEGHGLLTGF